MIDLVHEAVTPRLQRGHAVGVLGGGGSSAPPDRGRQPLLCHLNALSRCLPALVSKKRRARPGARSSHHSRARHKFCVTAAVPAHSWLRTSRYPTPPSSVVRMRGCVASFSIFLRSLRTKILRWCASLAWAAPQTYYLIPVLIAAIKIRHRSSHCRCCWRYRSFPEIMATPGGYGLLDLARNCPPQRDHVLPIGVRCGPIGPIHLNAAHELSHTAR